MKKLTIIFFFMSLALAGFSQNEAKLIRKGNSQFKKGDYKNAEINYRKSLELNANSVKGEFNLADALYSQENYEESAKLFDGMREKVSDVQQKSEVYHNLGNSLLEAEKYKESIEAYKQALRNNPNDMDTKYNLEYAKQKLKEEEEQQQDQKDDQNKDEENKDQEKEQDKKDQDQEQKEDQKDQEDQKGEQDKQNQEQPQPKQISKKDAERMLEALKNEEKKTLEKLKKEQAKNVKGKKVEKDW